MVVSFPTDEQWIRRMYNAKMQVKPLGRGKSMTETLNAEKINFELFQQIKKSGDDLDEFEASKVIDRLSRCEIIDSVREGAQFSVTTLIPGAKAVHKLCMPSAKQVTQYRRNVVTIIDGRRGAQEIRMNLAPAGELYDALLIEVSGYQDNYVPVIHKSAVVSEVLALLENEEDDSEVEGF